MTTNTTNATDLAVRIVEPVGYRLLVRLCQIDEKTKGGIYRPASTRDVEQTAHVVGEVLATGEDAYENVEKFPNGPWCRVGDFIMMRAYSGTRFQVDGTEYRLINDDTVEAVVTEPGRVERV